MGLFLLQVFLTALHFVLEFTNCLRTSGSRRMRVRGDAAAVCGWVGAMLMWVEYSCLQYCVLRGVAKKSYSHNRQQSVKI